MSNYFTKRNAVKAAAITTSFLPILVYAEGGLVNCDVCTFNDLFITLSGLIDFAIKDLALPLATIAIAYSGIQYVIAMGDPKATGAAKQGLINVVTGLLWVIAGALVIKFIFDSLVKSEFQ